MQYRVTANQTFEVAGDFTPSDPRKGSDWKPLFDAIEERYANDRRYFIGYLGLAGDIIEVLDHGRLCEVYMFVSPSAVVRYDTPYDGPSDLEQELARIKEVSAPLRCILVSRLYRATEVANAGGW